MTALTAVETRSLWTAGAPPPRYAPLGGDREVDVAVVGAGITGALTALLLKQAGKRVVVLEAAHVGAGETSRSTAHLTEVYDVRYHQLVHSFGRAAAGAAAAAQRAAIALIERFVDELRIDCGFSRVPGFLYAHDEAGVADLRAESEAADALGLAARLVDPSQLPFAASAALRFERQAQIDPVPFLRACLAALEGDGSSVHEETRVLAVHEGARCQVETERGTVTCESVVVAAHVPISNRLFLHAKLAPYRTYALAVRSELPQDTGLYWDTADPYHYIRGARVGGESYLIVGGEDHKVGHKPAVDPFEALERFIREHLGGRVGPDGIAARWSGQVIVPADGLPYIGRNSMSSRVFVATGFAGNGITGGALSALIISDEILDRPSPFASLFTATRMHAVASARAFVRENADVARRLIGDRLRGGDVDSLADVPRGAGRIALVRGERLAIYRDPSGQLTALSPVCTHLGCLVNWNEVENTWDCPCHGSRYDPYGDVINGPATAPLSRHELGQDDRDSERDAPMGLHEDPA